MSRIVEWREYVTGGAIVTCGLSVLMGFAASLVSAAVPRGLNVLFVAVDDLRPQLGCYGHAEMVTPSLDRLAREGRRFERHYVQVPTCGASRCALLTGQYPTSPKAYDNDAFATLPREVLRGAGSLPHLFQQNGYTTVCIGKISHSPDGKRPDGAHELPLGWTEAGLPIGQWKDAWAAFFAYAGGKTRIVGKTPVSERADVPDDAYPDGLIADAAVAKLRELKDQPFFLAVGFFKPHLPFTAPAQYWDLYDPNEIPGVRYSAPPQNVDPSISLHDSGEMLGRYTGFAQPDRVSDVEARNLRHAYRACVSYVDAQIGRVLEEVDRLGLRENTIVVVWGDHGWHLGEHGVWGKHTLHEVAMRSPLLVRLPNMSQPGAAASGLVESVDIYPTLSELCGLKAPSEVDGKSLVPMLEEPSAPGKAAVYGFWRNGRGHSIRTPRHRLVLWTGASGSSRSVQTELYDLQNDPLETCNIATEHPDIVKELSARLRKTIPVLQSRKTGKNRKSLNAN